MAKVWMKEAIFAGLAALVLGSATANAEVDTIAQAKAEDWPSYHRTYNAWRYSPLAKINRGNVGKLQVAWTHQPGAITHGLQATPVVLDGVVYYSGSYNRVFAIDGASGEEIWHYYAKNKPEVEQIATAPYNRGVSVGNGLVYAGTSDGRAIALDAKTGKEVWVTQLVDTMKCGCLFTSPPLLVKDKAIFGSTQGGMPARGGGIFGLNAKTGEKIWYFDPVKDDTWGNNDQGESSAKYAGVGAWHVGSYDAEQNLIIYGTSNPTPWFDWAPAADGEKGFRRSDRVGARPGDNLYASSVVALNPDTGELKWYFQEHPHDDWDYDSTLGEFVLIDQGSKKLAVHQAKSGFVYVYDRTNGKIENVWTINKHVSFVKNVDPKTGQLIGRNPPATSEGHMFCPSMNGGRSWNAGSYNPDTKLWYNSRQELCTIAKTRPEKPQLEPLPNWYAGADISHVAPPNDVVHGALDAWNPLTGKKKWSVHDKYPRLSGVLSTKGRVVFSGDMRGRVYAYDGETGKTLWSFNTGSGIRGGIVTYAAKGEQYVLVPSGIGSHVFFGLAEAMPETKDFPPGATLFAFKLPSKAKAHSAAVHQKSNKRVQTSSLQANEH